MKVYVDELGCNIHVKRSFTRSIRGERAYRPVATQPGLNVTVGAIEKNWYRPIIQKNHGSYKWYHFHTLGVSFSQQKELTSLKPMLYNIGPSIWGYGFCFESLAFPKNNQGSI